MIRRAASRISINVWPGYVDAMTALLLILMFLLTIFMVVQFVLQETIAGQGEELDILSADLAGLAEALGLEQDRSAKLQGTVNRLDTSLQDARRTADARAALIESLNSQSVKQQNAITGFEKQVASLLLRNTQLTDSLADSRSRVTLLTEQFEKQTADITTSADRESVLREQNRLLLADKETLERAKLVAISQQEALQLILAQLRSESDKSLELARLAAAKREALEAVIADLQAGAVKNEGSLADALAILASTETELTKIKDSFAAAQGEAATQSDALQQAREELVRRGQTQEELRARIESLLKGMSEETKARLAEAVAATALREKLQGAEDELTAMTLSLEAQRREAEDTLTLLAAAQMKISQTDVDAAELLSERDRKAALLAVAQRKLLDQEALSAEGARKIALLNQQTLALQNRLNSLQSLLDAAHASDVENKVQIKALGANLNIALARVAAEQSKLAKEAQRRAELESFEHTRLNAPAGDLEKFRSEFFGRLRDVLGGREGVRIVGDRFVFSSEILFPVGSAELGVSGEGDIAKVASIILDITDQIPLGIDWILRVDGHTDKTRVSANSLYQDNWELSQARALSVVRYLIADFAIPANRLSANGFGEFHPIAEGGSPQALALNRRIELKFTEK